MKEVWDMALLMFYLALAKKTNKYLGFFVNTQIFDFSMKIFEPDKIQSIRMVLGSYQIQ